MIRKIIIPLFLLSLVLVNISCNSSPPKDCKVTFIVEVKNPLNEQQVFITGNNSLLGGWVPNKVELISAGKNKFTKSISFIENTELEFKITAGNWWQEALDNENQFLENHKLNVIKDTTIIIIVYDWKNTFKNGEVVLSEKRFGINKTYMVLDDFWKYSPGDNIKWADVDYNDSTWRTATPFINWGDTSANKWTNVGWFRFHFNADSSLWNRSLALLISQLGASELYYNGRLLCSNGTIGQSKSSFKPSQVRTWKELKIEPKSDHVLAVRYANYNWKEQRGLGFEPGFIIYLKDVNTIFNQVEDVRSTANHQMIFTLIPIILFFLHLIIFCFNPKQKENLFYALCLLGFAGITYFSFEKYISTDPETIILYYILNVISVPITIFFGLLTSYTIIFNRLPWWIRLHAVVFLLVLINNYLNPSGKITSAVNYIYMGLIMADILVASFTGKNKKVIHGSWILFAGFAAMLVSIVLQLMIEYNLIASFVPYNQVFVYGMIGLAAAMSIFLSYNMAQINMNLEKQIILTEELSKKTIEQERLAAKLEYERKILDAEHERKTRELDDARNLQISLLPKKIPQLKNVDISFYMDAATEVVGDYYDIICSDDGTVTVVVGDATGHGVKAGIMVTLVKGLLYELSSALSPVEILDKINNVIRSMGMGNLYMGLTLIKITGKCLHISSAGMPPILLYRKKENKIDDIIFKRFPLGATNKLRFESLKINICEGDILLIVSDGLSELFNMDKEMFEFSRVKEILQFNAAASPSELITKLIKAGDDWRGECEQTDDMTLVAIKGINIPETVI